MKARYAVLVALIVVLVGVVGLSETRTYIEDIIEAQSIVLSGNLDFFAASSMHSPAYDSGDSWVMCDGVLVIDIYFNHDVTVQVNAESFANGSYTLPTQYGLVTIGAGPTWWVFENINTNIAAALYDQFTAWSSESLVWIGGEDAMFPYQWSLEHSPYPDGRKYCNAKVRVQRSGYGDPAGTYTATITVTFI